MSVLVSTLATSAYAVVALALCAPFAAWTAWSVGGVRTGSFSYGSLRVLASLPVAALALALFPHSQAWLFLWALGGFAPLALGLLALHPSTDERQLQAALALGLSRMRALEVAVVPVVARPLAGTLLRTLARLVGEAGLFLVVTGAPTLGALAWSTPTVGLAAVFALGGSALAFAMLGEHLEGPVRA